MFKLSRLALVVCAGAVTAGPTARAADLAAPIPQAVLKGWYLRGDIGYSNQRVDQSRQRALCDDRRSSKPVTKNSRARPSLTSVSAIAGTTGFASTSPANTVRRRNSTAPTSTLTPVGGGTFPDTYFGKKSEWLALVNVLSRSRHLARPEPLRRRRRRYRRHQDSAPSATSVSERAAARLRRSHMRAPTTNGTSPGPSMPASALRSPTR